jgi:beta-galactosidase
MTSERTRARPDGDHDGPSEAPASGPRPRLSSRGLQLGDGREVALRSGAMHYFRIERAHWRRCLQSMRELGLQMVETYVPWGVHEGEDGTLDFGAVDPRLDLAAFLDLAHELGMLVFLRPGPHINAELPYFGLPRRIVFDPENQARSPRGNPLPLPAPPRFFPVPSYASENLRRETGAWFHAVGEIVAPRRHPDGPVVMVQVDNEAAFYFRDAPYDGDYHPDAIAGFRRYVAERYGSPSAMNAVWGSTCGSFEELEPPRRSAIGGRDALPRRLDWMAYQELLVCDALSDLREQLEAAGMGELPTSHNLPMGDAGLATSLGAVGRTVDVVGLDYYHSRRGLDLTRRKTLRLDGAASPCFAPELGVGAPPWFGPRPDREALLAALGACAFGLRAFNLYMAVDRDRWYGAPIAQDGELRRSSRRWRRFLDALDRTQFHRLRRRVQVAITLPREYARLSRATHALGAASPSVLDLAGLPATSGCRRDSYGFAQPIQLAWTKLVYRLDRALCEHQVPFVYLEGDADLQAHGDLELVFAPSYEFAAPARFDRLARFAEGGGEVVWGPVLPSLDDRLQPASFAPPGGRAPMRLDSNATTEELVAALVTELELDRPFRVSPRSVLSTVHEDDSGARVVFLVNPGPGDVRAEVRVPQPMRLSDAMSDEHFDGRQIVVVPMAGRSCRMLVIERDSTISAPPRRRGPSARAGRSE